MNQILSPNSQAILLLTAPLIAGRNDASPPLLTLGEYNRLARTLRDEQRQPADLIGPDARRVISLCERTFDRTRLEQLLGRGFLLAQAVDRWNTCAIWLLSRADAAYPRGLRTRLKEEAPPILYGCGDPALLETGGLAVVGSRHVDDVLIEYSYNVGRIAASAHRTVISGGAKGVDRAAMDGALQNGGTVIAVLAERLEQAALARDYRGPLLDHKLVLVSPYDPAAGFNVGHAMQRNKFIYAFADMALVVNSDFEKGGTWAGAIEQLERLHLVPVYVRNGANASEGNSALLRRGGLPWPDPTDGLELNRAMRASARAVTSEGRQELLPFDRIDESSQSSAEVPPDPAVTQVEVAEVSKVDATPTPAKGLPAALQEILVQQLREPRTEAEVAKLLAISRSQAKAWLTMLEQNGMIEKVSKRSVRFRLVKMATVSSGN